MLNHKCDVTETVISIATVTGQNPAFCSVTKVLTSIPITLPAQCGGQVLHAKELQ